MKARATLLPLLTLVVTLQLRSFAAEDAAQDDRAAQFTIAKESQAKAYAT
jgi:hypothetical protein